MTFRGGFKAENLFGHITRKASSPLPSPPSPPVPFPSLPSLLLPSSPPIFPPPPLEVGPQIQLWDLGERCKLPSGVWGQSPSLNRIWCILALKSGGNNFNDFSENQLNKFHAV